MYVIELRGERGCWATIGHWLRMDCASNEGRGTYVRIPAPFQGRSE